MKDENVLKMESQKYNLFKILILIIIIFCTGTFGYYFIEKDWTLMDSFYMTAISITTVGYGETKPLSDAGRIFTVFLIFCGLGSAAVFATQLARAFVENNFKRYFGESKMLKKIKNLKGHYIICGFGGIGSSISYSLHDSDIPFVVVENNEETASWAQKRNYLTVIGKATYDSTLIQAGIKKASGIVVSMGDDSINMYVSLAARELNPDLFIIARGYKSDIENRLIRAGANKVVYPLKMGGEQIANQIKKKFSKNKNIETSDYKQMSVMGYTLKIYNHFNDEEITVADVKKRTGAESIPVLKKMDNTVLNNPSPDTVLEKNDSLLLLVNDSEKSKIFSLGSKTSLFDWSDDYNTGILAIDEEHQNLFEITDNFTKAIKKGYDKDLLTVYYDRLIESTIEHFANEEDLFRETDYPFSEDHIKEHRILSEKVIELNRNRNYAFSDNVEEFLYNWLKDHIMEEDFKFAEYYHKKM